MGWAVGFDTTWNRDIGYGVPAYCDHPDCNAVIDRGLSRVCCDQEPFGGESGCGLYFCSKHAGFHGQCERCENDADPFDPSPDHPKWMRWKLIHPSWKQWRTENSEEVVWLKIALGM